MKITLTIPISLLLVLSSVIAKAQITPTVTNIDINNIDAKITSSSDLFWDFISQGFEVPKGSQKHTIFAGGLWMGGMDTGGNLHMSAQTYNQTGGDYQPGPLDTIGGLSATNPVLWNKSWKLNKSEVLDHIANYSNVGYTVPQNIAEWPGYDAGLQRVLAPFADYNSNGIYDPANGDYPYILGDQTVYSIFNDYVIHAQSGCDTIGVEIHRTFFGFDDTSNVPLNNSVFSRYEIKNFSAIDYPSYYITIWTDFDLGNAMDDYVGTDLNLDMVYAYNGDIDDETPAGYGLNPPAMGVFFLNQTLYSSVAYDNINGSPVGNPSGCYDFLNYANGIWADNQPITYGADGRDPGNPVTTYMYTGITDPVNYPLLGEWSESLAGNAPGDRRMIGSIGPFNLPAQGYITFDVGYTYARATSGGPAASVVELQNAVSSLRVMYDNGVLTALPGSLQNLTAGISVYPNPAVDEVMIKLPDANAESSVTIIDLRGRLIYEQSGITGDKHAVDTKDFSKGIYILTALQSGKVYNVKLVVQ